MQYLVNPNKIKHKAHIWLGRDTACTMWTTGGLNQDHFGVVEDTEKSICSMCLQNYGIIRYSNELEDERRRLRLSRHSVSNPR